ncbi:DUF4127 family protein [Cohnella pontilimi]|uniref:DUF4127 family protein n=1 Tax=Cohnella pontilimi TaxID=2564100 RepID=A0A4U0FHN5_9BACL|nr:DUF4127 family protein [Cohnella pontilimi]TJY44536.1 DUF4127 family protein [Cohnella pontilimi]
MDRIVYLPLDERPCNAKFPLQIAAAADIEMAAPPPALLGRKKQPADTARIADWLQEQTSGSGYLIVSLDMLVYGGIVPSRLHYLSIEDCRSRLQTLAQLKKANPKLRIYAFNLIMRAPAYNSSDEEPDYYADYGAQLSMFGRLQDKQAREGLTESERMKWEQLSLELPEAVQQDFIGRRRINSAVNELAVELTANETIDFLIIPLDDNAKYGYSSSEQRKLLASVQDKQLFDRVHIYPGADEVGNTLFARVFCEIRWYQPDIFIRHSSASGPFAIPKYEDRSLAESLKCQITAAGGYIADHASDADFVLMINSPPVGQYDMAETTDSFEQRHASYFSEINYREFAHAIRRYADKGYMLALADVATCNGADEPLMKLLSGMGLLSSLSAYAGWNTSGNSLGTVIPHAIVESYFHKKEKKGGSVRSRNSEAFYLSRLVEDWGYQAIVRMDVAYRHIEKLGGNYFDVAAIHDQAAALIQDKLQAFIDEFLKELDPGRIRLENVILPWKRMFEVGFDLHLEA